MFPARRVCNLESGRYGTFMENEYSVAAHWQEPFEEAGFQRWVQQLRGKLRGEKVSLGLVFIAPRFFPQAGKVLEILRIHGQAPLLAGCSSSSLIAGGEELEGNAGIAVGLYALPGAELKAFHFNQKDVETAGQDAGHWERCSRVSASETNGWLVFADPFRMDGEAWLESWNAAYGPLPTMGGLASGEDNAQYTQVYLNGEVFDEGGVAISVGGRVELAGVISQGCTPIGETWTLTRVDGNLIQQIGNRPAYEVLAETFNSMPTTDQRKSRGNLFVGLVTNEYLEEFHRGDFLVRNLLGADPQTGAIAVGALPRTGQTLQFQRRDAAAATEDMEALLSRAKEQLKDATIFGGCLCCCNGRGKGMFGTPNHDAQMVQAALGPMGLTGFFCNGEIGPVGKRNFLHGYTAALALFVRKSIAA
jgi:small ligand-binding sensory domain FIST